MKPAIHQYTPGITPGDGVSQSLFFIQKILTDLGYVSRIYSDDIYPGLNDRVFHRTKYDDRGDNILLLHHAVAQPAPEWVINLKDPMVMVYHNITPSHYFSAGTPHRNATQAGRQQLDGWQNLFAGIIAISGYNARELKGLGYQNIHEIPLLIDFEKISKIRADQTIVQKHEETFNLLFVGRIAENKCQHDLIHALAQMKDKTVHLFLVGGISSHEYQHYLAKLVESYHLQEQVHFTGRVSDEVLWGYYRTADLFVCMSDHEGFGIPLIEASSIGLPVVAYDSSNIRHTLDNTGLLLSCKNSADVAVVWQQLMEQPEWRYRLGQSQQANLSRFHLGTLTQQLKTFLESLIPGDKPPLPLEKKIEPKKHLHHIDIEGPFDNNYSLALVNRELATALGKPGGKIQLHSTEGGGDYLPDLNFLEDHPQITAMWDKGTRQKKADLAIRNLYPPRVTGMNGKRKVIGPYGWEESVFPEKWAASFNRRLHLVTTMSDYVTQTLKNNGVAIPMVTIGIGADHLKNVQPAPLPFDFPPGYTLLHISSCFPRKGVDLLVEAFDTAYPCKTATLIIKTFPNPHNDLRLQLYQDGWINKSEILFCKNQKEILVIEEDLTPGQMVSLYKSSDLLIAPSRGEGFGLPMAEAMLFDLPVLTTGFGGQVDFCSRKTAWLIDYTFARAKTHMELYDSVWAEPDLDDMIKQMKKIAGLSPEQIKEKTKPARENICTHHTWAQVAKRLHQAIENLDSQVCPLKVPRIGWVSTWNTPCGIASYSKYLVHTLGAEKVVILANHSQVVKKDAPNVFRCWEAGDKDPLQTLHQTILTQKVTDLVIQFNFSFFQLQALAKFLTDMETAKIRCYLFLHSTADVMPPHEPKSLSTIKQVLCRIERLFVHSVKDLNCLKAMGIVKNVILFPHGVKIAPKKDSPVKPTPTPRQDDILIATYGFLLPHKGISELITAFEILRESNPKFKLLLLNALYPTPASTQEQNLCRQKIDQSPHGKDITMINEYLTESDLHERLSRARVIVYPCQDTQESSSASVRAGLATGRPVAVTPLAIFEDVADVVVALPGITPQKMARGIQAMINDTRQIDSITARQQTWLDFHSWQILGKRLHAIILAGNNSAGSDNAGSDNDK